MENPEQGDQELFLHGYGSSSGSFLFFPCIPSFLSPYGACLGSSLVSHHRQDRVLSPRGKLRGGKVQRRGQSVTPSSLNHSSCNNTAADVIHCPWAVGIDSLFSLVELKAPYFASFYRGSVPITVLRSLRKSSVSFLVVVAETWKSCFRKGISFLFRVSESLVHVCLPLCAQEKHNDCRDAWSRRDAYRMQRREKRKDQSKMPLKSCCQRPTARSHLREVPEPTKIVPLAGTQAI